MITHPGVPGCAASSARITVPKNERELDPMLLIIPIQLMAYHAALHTGPATSTSRAIWPSPSLSSSNGRRR